LGLLGDYAVELEADLRREYNVDIADWYRGKLSSRTVLSLVSQLSEQSSFRLAHDWPLQGHLMAALINEIRAMRGDLWALIGKEQMTYKPLLPPSSQRLEDAKRAETRAVHDQIVAQMRGTTEGGDIDG
jgi:hypothetical protein